MVVFSPKSQWAVNAILKIFGLKTSAAPESGAANGISRYQDRRRSANRGLSIGDESVQGDVA
jgi:hypothetical protein